MCNQYVPAFVAATMNLPAVSVKVSCEIEAPLFLTRTNAPAIGELTESRTVPSIFQEDVSPLALLQTIAVDMTSSALVRATNKIRR
jgi:hypothetical protein